MNNERKIRRIIKEEVVRFAGSTTPLEAEIMAVAEFLVQANFKIGTILGGDEKEGVREKLRQIRSDIHRSHTDLVVLRRKNREME